MNIALFCRRNVGLCALSYFVACGHEVQVVTDDVSIAELAENLGMPIVAPTEIKDYDLIVSVHWHKIIPMEYILGKKSFNVHPCLGKYPGKDPIAKYIANVDTEATIDSHVMTEKPDEGEVLISVPFKTSICRSYAEFYNAALPYYFKCFTETMKRICG